MDVGTDIVAVSRIAALIHARGSVFLQRWFTPVEIEKQEILQEQGAGPIVGT